VSELGYRAKRRARRRRIAQLVAGVLCIYAVGFATGYISKRETVVPVEGSTPQTCITLAVFPIDVLPKPSAVTLNVLNGSKRVGMASITADVMKSRKFKINTVGNFDEYFVENEAEVHYGPEGAQAAQLVAAYIDGAKLVEDTRTGNAVDLVIGQAFDVILENDEVAEVLARPSASPSGPGC
jgi:hypothetical protein